jgi:hypothetical protein
MNISGNIYDNNGHSQHVNLWAPDPPRAAPQTPVAIHSRHLHGLAKAGVFGIIALVVIAIVAGVLAILPKPLRVLVILAAIGWVIWSVATYKAPEATSDAQTIEAPRAELVKLPEPEVRRATLVNPHPNH